jgi:hypothetical protein
MSPIAYALTDVDTRLLPEPVTVDPGVTPQPPDAERGLALYEGWLVSSPNAPHYRWLAGWCQDVLECGWALAILTGRDVGRALRVAARLLCGLLRLVWRHPHFVVWSLGAVAVATWLRLPDTLGHWWMPTATGLTLGLAFGRGRGA